MFEATVISAKNRNFESFNSDKEEKQSCTIKAATAIKEDS